MDRWAQGRTLAIGVIVSACASTAAWASPWMSDEPTKAAPPPSYVETIYQPGCPTDEHCRLWQRCAVCEADRHP